MQKLSEVGRRMLFWAGLTVIVWALMELANKSALITDTIEGSVWRAYQDKVLSFRQFITYLPWNTLWIPFFLLGCVILGLMAVFTRRRSYMFVLMVPLGIAALVVVLKTPRLFTWLGIDALWQVINVIKILSLTLIPVGSVLSLVCQRYFRGRRKQAAQNAPPPGTRRFW